MSQVSEKHLIYKYSGYIRQAAKAYAILGIVGARVGF